MRELFKLSFVLTLICSFAALSLGVAHNLTKDPIAEQQRLKKIRALREVFSQYDVPETLPTAEVVVGRDADGKAVKQKFFLVGDDGKIFGIAFESFTKGYNGEIHLLTGVTVGGEIAGVKVISHSETPGLGANIVQDMFSGQFRGMSLEKNRWTVKKNGGDIDQVTGATISSSAVIDAMKSGLQMVSDHKSEILDQTTER